MAVGRERERRETWEVTESSHGRGDWYEQEKNDVVFVSFEVVFIGGLRLE